MSNALSLNRSNKELLRSIWLPILEKEGLTFDSEALTIVLVVEGGMRDALSILDQALSLSPIIMSKPSRS